MKIVTAGHRGIVATGDEIREVRNNRRRMFSYSLILLSSLCCGGEAAATKLCRRAAVPGASIALNNSARLWATGVGCSSEPTVGIDSWEIYIPRAAKTGTDVAQFCANRRASGTFKCAAPNHYWSGIDSIADDPVNGTQCTCGVKHINGVDTPSNSVVFTLVFKSYGVSECNTFCGYHCARYFDTRIAEVLF